MIEWLSNNGLEEKLWARLYFYSEKPQANLLIDDRAWRFCGEFPEMELIDSLAFPIV